MNKALRRIEKDQILKVKPKTMVFDAEQYSDDYGQIPHLRDKSDDRTY